MEKVLESQRDIIALGGGRRGSLITWLGSLIDTSIQFKSNQNNKAVYVD
jgi:hypothetical protein